MKVHFIAIGGSAMHNLAIALHKKEYFVSGSDDEIFEPSKGRLKNYNLLPKNEGWFPEKITKKLDAVIVGMHARNDNPELLKAKELGIKIFSYPEYLYEQSKNKIRVVIGGSHGKTTITAMILHVLNYNKINCDYMVGAQLEGFEVMVKLSEEAKIMLIEGDEYLTSPIDRRPKFHLYKPNIALLSGIAWDHINVFPTWENYLEQFRIFIELIEKGGSLVYCEEDKNVKMLAESTMNKINKIAYKLPDYVIKNGITYLKENEVSLKIFGKHNLQNLSGAKLVCKELGITNEQFNEAIKHFSGASKRLELVGVNEKTMIFKDFAHSPSKLKASVNAVKEQFQDRKLIACIELHTFSSLNKDFLTEYKGCLDKADTPIVYFNSHTIKLKRLPELSPKIIKKAFSNNRLKIYIDSKLLEKDLIKRQWDNTNLLMMSSGNFDGIDFKSLVKKILSE
ncbi:MAG: peptidoglycan synthetase [Bacteroidales bacterium]|nr:peptidoglycan synthetase [Bacteroidales bacterium]